MENTILKDRYRIVKKLGYGGFGVTFLAEDKHSFNSRCVVKELAPYDQDPNKFKVLKGIFEREAKALFNLGTHPQIPRFYENFDLNEKFYIIQEFVEGQVLSQKISPGQVWSEADVIKLLKDVLETLNFIHGKGVIHRDLKPENLIQRQEDQRIVVIDFGAVKEVSITQVIEPYSGETRITDIIGTPGYMPPEQRCGKPRDNSDIYALGIIAIQALTGKSPDQLISDPTTLEISWKEWVQVSSKLANILDKMICYDCRNRFESAKEILEFFQNEDTITTEEKEKEREINISINFRVMDKFFHRRQQNQKTLNPDYSGQTPKTPLSNLTRATLSKITTHSHEFHDLVLGQYQKHDITVDQAQDLARNFQELAAIAPIVTRLEDLTILYDVMVEFYDYVDRFRSPQSNYWWSRDYLSQAILPLARSLVLEHQSNKDWKCVQTLNYSSLPALAVAFNPDGHVLAEGGWDRTLRFWDPTTGHLIQSVVGIPGAIRDLAYSPQGDWLAIAGDNGTAQLLDIAANQRVPLKGHLSWVNAVDFSPCGKQLTTGGHDRVLRLWQIDHSSNHTVIFSYPLSAQIWAIAFSPKGTYLAVTTSEGLIYLFDVATQEISLIHTFRGHKSAVKSLAFTQDQFFLFSGSLDKTLRLWNIPLREELWFWDNRDPIEALALSHDRTAIVTGGGFGSMKLWDMGQLQSFRQLIENTGAIVYDLAFNAQGDRLASSHFDGSVRIWQPFPQEESLERSPV
ncbi:serine/threonine protein kinase [Candidatus Synechococcus calcipolaris G9]|uniref:Serine/threonine protein kinase n=1 Tax=Candidatus Synechococcus calcipolaris G9 TaxID=1497997 RepID=A0ABT6F348_9SYNE|nr:serine/threonine-protein kinase [Candidatus Synechococcus calcipolaris]MDG2992289.1 serine/threonine protein kinase [Candidatus Synechococcus calcipolaris G9]